MLFPTFDYFVFLPLVAMVHQAFGHRGFRTAWLLLASLLFYAAWNPIHTLLLLSVIGVAFVGGLAIPKIPERAQGPVSASFALTLLAPLLFYKYTGVLIGILPQIPAPPDIQPIGISFFTFQAIAYVIDVKRGEAPERNPIRFCTFLTFFPHLAMGPILRARSLLDQLAADRVVTAEDVGVGVSRLAMGLVKKLLVADVLRLGMVDSVFTDPSMFTGLEVLIALYAFSMQIYCDFSGYTDFAVGSARLFGIRIPENFDRPYQALTVASYWRRWHITLSDWVRDYVYYPMGGSRGGGLRPYFNTLVTMLILGVWHGASFTFVVYGLLHAAAVSFNRFWKKGPALKLPEPGPLVDAWRWFVTFHFVVLARILWRADSLAHAWDVTLALANFSLMMPRFSSQAWVVLIVGYLAHFTPRSWTPSVHLGFARLPAPAWGAALALVAWACIVWGAGDALAFIYGDI